MTTKHLCEANLMVTGFTMPVEVGKNIRLGWHLRRDMLQPLATFRTFESVALVASTHHRFVRLHLEEAHLGAARKTPHVTNSPDPTRGHRTPKTEDSPYHTGRRERRSQQLKNWQLIPERVGHGYSLA